MTRRTASVSDSPPIKVKAVLPLCFFAQASSVIVKSAAGAIQRDGHGVIHATVGIQSKAETLVLPLGSLAGNERLVDVAIPGCAQLPTQNKNRWYKASTLDLKSSSL